MTDTTDAVVGTVGGLLALGIMANVAGKIMNGQKSRPRLMKPLKPMKLKKMKVKKHKAKFF